MDSPPPTMKSVAEACGLSRAAVSMALRNHPKIPKATRERVFAAAKKVGYKPNPLVSALMSARVRHTPATGNMALLNLDVTEERDGFTAGALAQAEQLGYSMEEYVLKKPMTAERLRRILIARGVRGIVILPAKYAPFHLDFDFSGFAVAAIGFSVKNERLTRITSDPYLRMLEAIRQASQRGYTRLGIVNDRDLEERFNHAMAAGAAIAPEVLDRPLEIHRFYTDPGQKPPLPPFNA